MEDFLLYGGCLLAPYIDYYEGKNLLIAYPQELEKWKDFLPKEWCQIMQRICAQTIKTHWERRWFYKQYLSLVYYVKLSDHNDCRVILRIGENRFTIYILFEIKNGLGREEDEIELKFNQAMLPKFAYMRYPEEEFLNFTESLIDPIVKTCKKLSLDDPKYINLTNFCFNDANLNIPYINEPKADKNIDYQHTTKNKINAIF